VEKYSVLTGKRTIIFPAVTAVLIILLYLPVFIWLVNSWISNEYYRHGFLIPIVSGFIFWLRRQNLKTSKPFIPGAIVFGAGLVLYAISFLMKIYSLSAFSLLIVISGIIAYRCGKERIKPLIFPVLFLILMIPLPFLDTVSCQLQTFTTYSSASIAHWAGIPVVTIGNQIDIPGSSFTVGTPCSGINSLISLLAIAAIVNFLVEGTAWKRVFLLLLAIPVAMLANTVRISAMLLIASRWGAETAMDYFHDFSSLLLFLLAIALLILIAFLMRMKPRTWQELKQGRRDNA
jgi:exosortase